MSTTSLVSCSALTFLPVFFVMTFKLGSDCNLDKDLSKSEGWSQLVKYKNTKVYL